MDLYMTRVVKDEVGGSSGQNSVAPYYGQKRVIEPYTTTGPNFQPPSEPIMEPYNSVGPYSEPYIPIVPYFKPTPEPPNHTTILSRSVEVSLPLPQSLPHPRPLPVAAYDEAGSDFENINEIPDVQLETGDEIDEGDWDSDHLESLLEDSASGGNNGLVRINPFNGWASTHPFECFNDTSGFQEADIRYFGYKVQKCAGSRAIFQKQSRADKDNKRAPR